MCTSEGGAPRSRQDGRFVGVNTSVTAEDLLVHYGSDGQTVEAVGERLPQLDVESAFTCNNGQGSESRAVSEISNLLFLVIGRM